MCELLWKSTCKHMGKGFTAYYSMSKLGKLVTPVLVNFNLHPSSPTSGFYGPLQCFCLRYSNWPKCIYCPLCSLSRCSVVRKPPAEHLPAELMAHSLMAHTSALLLLEHGSLKCTGVMVEEQQCKPLATLPVFPVLVSSVRLMARSNSIGVRKGTTGSHTLSPTTDVSTTKAMVKTVAMEHSNGEVKMALG